MAGNGQKQTDLRRRVFKMVSVGVVDDRINQGYDVVSTALLLTVHGTNERVPVAAMAQGVAFFKRYIRRLSAR